MKPTKKTAAKRPAKRRPAKKAYRSDSIIGKLLKLKYSINEACEGGFETTDDKNYIMELISNIRHRSDKVTKLCKEDFEKCNAMWRQYN